MVLNVGEISRTKKTLKQLKVFLTSISLRGANIVLSKL